MKAGEKEAAVAEPQAVEAAQVPTVNIYTGPAAAGKAAVATDEVPEGALEDSKEGKVNVYDADGNKTGTITAEEAAEAAEGVTHIEVE